MIINNEIRNEALEAVNQVVNEYLAKSNLQPNAPLNIIRGGSIPRKIKYIKTDTNMEEPRFPEGNGPVMIPLDHGRKLNIGETEIGWVFSPYIDPYWVDDPYYPERVKNYYEHMFKDLNISVYVNDGTKTIHAENKTYDIIVLKNIFEEI